MRPVDVPPIPDATAALAWRVHPRWTDEMRVRDALGPLFTGTDFTLGPLAAMFSGLGQLGLSPALLLVVVILQFRHNLADHEAAEAAADRIAWKYALGRELDDPGVDHTVLSEFRSRLAADCRADAVFDLTLARLKDAGLLRSGGRHRTDATEVLGCVRRLNRIETCGETLPAALEEIAAICLLGRKNGSAQSLAE